MSKKILVVDDEPGILEALHEILKMEQYTVETLSHGDKVQDHIQSFNPDLVLLDIYLSGKDGRQICKYLKQQPEYKQLPVILMSAHHNIEQSVKETQADAFIAKPFDIDTMLATLEYHLQKAKN